MKKILPLALLVPLAGCMTNAQVAPEPAPSYTYAPAVAQQPLFTPAQLDILLGAIALYPDPLVALILPASTNASDVVLAARWLQAGGDPSQAELQPWDDSVQALAHYPEIVRWMDQNLTWTKQLGDAFATEPGDVMAAIQRLRARARAAGTLVSTPQQQVIVDSDGIRILPAQPDVIHIPYYDPSVVYVRNYYTYPSETYFNYSSGLAAGWWLSYSLDWGSRSVWTIDRYDRQRYWREHERDWNRQPPRPRVLPGYPGTVPGHVWRPNPSRNDTRPGQIDTRPGRIDTRPPQTDTRPATGQRPGWQRSERDERWRDQRRGETVQQPVVGPSAPAAPPPAATSDRDSGRSRGNTRGVVTPPSDRRSPVPPSMGSPVPPQAWQGRAQPPAPSVSPAPQPRPAPPLHTGTPPPPAYRGPSAPPPAPPAPPPAQTQQSAPPSSPPPAQNQSQESSEERQPPPRLRPH